MKKATQWRQLHDGRVRDVKRMHQANLFKFLVWRKHFHETNDGEEPDLQIDFGEDEFHAFAEGPDFSRTKELLLRLHGLPVGSGTEEDEGGNALYELFLDSGVELKYLSKPEHRARFLPFAAKQIEKNMGDNLQRACRALNLNVPEVIALILQRLVPVTQDDPSPSEPLVVAGKTQSGKSAFKAVVPMVCSMLRMPTVVMTKDVSESKDLHFKLARYVAGTEAERSCFSPYASLEADITVSFNRGRATLVIPDTASKIKLATRVISRYQEACSGSFVVIFDEADVMYRTVDRSQNMEVALKSLQDFAPALELFVSATPVPLLLLYKEEFKQNLAMYSLEASHDYVGVHQMECLQDENGSSLYLDSLKHGEGIAAARPPPYSEIEDTALFEKDGEYRFDSAFVPENHIPQTDEKVMQLYDHALSGAKGVLVLDCTLSRIYAEDNTFQKAARVQDHYRSQGKDIFVVVNVGKGAFYRAPGEKYGKMCSKEIKISEVIAKIDEKHRLEMPIFVFGYSKMKRCISYRSSMRVPTHIVLFMGQGYSVESVVQALGRATFTGRDLLKENGHTSVTMLMQSHDVTAVLKYTLYVEEIQERLDAGDTRQDSWVLNRTTRFVCLFLLNESLINTESVARKRLKTESL